MVYLLKFGAAWILPPGIFVILMFVLAAHMNSIFLTFALVFVIISVVILSLGIESKKKSLEEIDASFKIKTT